MARQVVHVCNMTALLPSTKYFYRFGSTGSKYGFSKPYSFETPAAPGPTTSGAAKVSAIVYGDMGLDYSKGADDAAVYFIMIVVYSPLPPFPPY